MNLSSQYSMEYLCRHLIRDESGIWQSEQPEMCHYPEDGQERLVHVEEKSFWFIHRRNCVIEMIRHFPPQHLVMDVGGGNGLIAAGLKHAGFNVILLEPNVNSVRYASRRGVTQIICATVAQAKFEPHSIPAIGIFDVLEHIEDDRSFLCRLREVIETSGRLYLTVPAFGFLWSQEDRYARHFRRYRMAKLRLLLRECGFAVDYSTYFFSYLLLPLLFVKTIPTQLGLSRLYTHEQTWQEHVLEPGIKKRVLEKIHGWEMHRINESKTIPWGTSIMVAAHAC